MHQNSGSIPHGHPWVRQHLEGLSIGEDYKVTLSDARWRDGPFYNGGGFCRVTIENADGTFDEYDRPGVAGEWGSQDWEEWDFTFTASMKDPSIMLSHQGFAGNSHGGWLIRHLKIERVYKIGGVKFWKTEGPVLSTPITTMTTGYELDSGSASVRVFHSGNKGIVDRNMGNYKLFGSSETWQQLAGHEVAPKDWSDDNVASSHQYSWVTPYFQLGAITSTTSSTHWSDITNTLVQYPLAAPTTWNYPTRTGTWSNFEPPLKQALLASDSSQTPSISVFESDSGSPTEGIKIEDTMRAIIADSKLALYDGIGKITLEDDAWGVHVSDIDDMAIIRHGEINMYPDWEPGVLYKKGEGMCVRDLFDGDGDQYYVCVRDHVSTNDEGDDLSSSYKPYIHHYVDPVTKEITHSSRGVVGWWDEETSYRFKGGYFSGNRGSPLYLVQQYVARPYSTFADYRDENLEANAAYSAEGLDQLAERLFSNGWHDSDKIGELQPGEKLIEMGFDVYKKIFTRVGSNKSRILFAESETSTRMTISQLDLSPTRDVDEWNAYPSTLHPFNANSLFYFGDPSAGGFGAEMVSSIDISNLDDWQDTADPHAGEMGGRLDMIIKKENLSLLIVDDYIGGDDERYSSTFVYCPPKPNLRARPWISSSYAPEDQRWDWWSEDESGDITGSVTDGVLDQEEKMGLIKDLYSHSSSVIREDRFPATSARNRMFLPSDMFNVWPQEFGRPVPLALSGEDIGSFENINWIAGYNSNDRRYTTGQSSGEIWGLSEGGTDGTLGFDATTEVSDGDWGYLRGSSSTGYGGNALRGWLKWSGRGDDGIDSDMNFVPDSVATDPNSSSSVTGQIWKASSYTGLRWGGYASSAYCNGLLLIKNGASDWGSPNSGVGAYVVGLQATSSRPNSISTQPFEFQPLGVMYRVSVKVAIPSSMPINAGRVGYLTPSQSVRFDAFVDRFDAVTRNSW